VRPARLSRKGGAQSRRRARRRACTRAALARRTRGPTPLLAALAPPQAIKWAASAPEVPELVRPLVAAAAAAAAAPSDFNAVSQSFGSSCAMPGALQNALVAAARSDSFEGGVRINALAGGDNCSRACYLGALLGAAFGGPPAEWAARVTGFSGFEAAAARVAARQQ
jgi:hypothetical protein